MTAALALVPVTPTAPDVRLDLTYAGPAVPSLLRVCKRHSDENPVAFEHSVAEDRRPCPFCDQPIETASVREGTGVYLVDGEWRWGHALCAQAITKEIAMSVRKGLRHLPPCRNCGEPLVGGHTRYNVGAYCENEADTMYEPAPAIEVAEDA